MVLLPARTIGGEDGDAEARRLTTMRHHGRRVVESPGSLTRMIVRAGSGIS